MDLKKLSEPFPVEDIEFRIGRAGKSNSGVWAVALAYITSRAIHDRLDDVCGPEGWQMRYKEHLGATVCEIGIKADGEWIWKAGGSDKTQIEAFKGGLSGAEKRAGVPWGIGRYLYKLTESYVDVSLEKKHGWKYQGENKQKQIPKFYWNPKPLPAFALPKVEPITFPDLEKLKAEFPEHYKEMIDHYQGTPATIEQSKMAIRYINQLIDASNCVNEAEKNASTP